MRKSGRPTFGVVAALILVLQVTLAGGKTKAGKSSANSNEVKTTEQVYKNIKVLKGAPADQLIPAMEFITASLGVHCDFCHVEGHFDKDDKKPKQIARKMMVMMFAINKDNFEGERKVTCYSCHRGSPKPVATPLIEEASASPMMAATPRPMSTPGLRQSEPPLAMAGTSEPEQKPDLSKLPPASEVIEKYVQAIGGKEAIRRVSSRVEKGNVTMFGRQFSVEIVAQAPAKYRETMDLPKGKDITVYDGREGWMAFPGRPVREMGSADVDAARMDGDLMFPTDATNVFTELRVAKPEIIDGRVAYQILGIRAGQPPAQLYFDEQSGLLVRLERYAESPLGLYPTQVNYSDYRSVDGVKIPFRITTARPGSSVAIQLNSVQQNVPIDESTFAKPAGSHT